MEPRPNLLPGTLDLLILQTLAREEPVHGWAVAERIRQLSDGLLEVNQGSLYPALRRLEGQGLVTAEWGVSGSGRRARFYRLTASGRRSLGEERSRWEALVRGVALVMEGE